MQDPAFSLFPAFMSLSNIHTGNTVCNYSFVCLFVCLFVFVCFSSYHSYVWFVGSYSSSLCVCLCDDGDDVGSRPGITYVFSLYFSVETYRKSPCFERLGVCQHVRQTRGAGRGGRICSSLAETINAEPAFGMHMRAFTQDPP